MSVPPAPHPPPPAPPGLSHPRCTFLPVAWLKWLFLASPFSHFTAGTGSKKKLAAQSHLFIHRHIPRTIIYTLSPSSRLHLHIPTSSSTPSPGFMISTLSSKEIQERSARQNPKGLEHSLREPLFASIIRVTTLRATFFLHSYQRTLLHFSNCKIQKHLPTYLPTNLMNSS